MRLNRTVFAGLAGLCLLLIGLISVVGLNLARASDPIPEAVYDCLPPRLKPPSSGDWWRQLLEATS